MKERGCDDCILFKDKFKHVRKEETQGEVKYPLIILEGKMDNILITEKLKKIRDDAKQAASTCDLDLMEEVSKNLQDLIIDIEGAK